MSLFSCLYHTGNPLEAPDLLMLGSLHLSHWKNISGCEALNSHIDLFSQPHDGRLPELRFAVQNLAGAPRAPRDEDGLRHLPRQGLFLFLAFSIWQ